jgi:uncharacterized protein YgbK (DUF1537 family)
MRPPAILADDLTGALDTAAQFTGRWPEITVQYGVTGLPLPPPCAITSETRDRPKGEALVLSLAAARELEHGVTFRKIDSLLRGPWAAELAALYRDGGFADCVLAPAFPEQERVTRGGWQISPGTAPVDIAAHLLREGLSADGPVRIADASTTDDLIALVAREAPREPLWCGSAGLARALAGVPPRRPALPPAPTLAVVGSDHPVTREQLSVLARRRPDAVRCWTPGTETSLELDPEGLTVLSFGFPPETPRKTATEEVARVLKRVVSSGSPPARLVVTGGTTLASLLDAVGAKRMTCLGEVAAGLPVSRIEDGLWAGVEVFSKSGAFGGADSLADLCMAPYRLAPVKGFDA